MCVTQSTPDQELFAQELFADENAAPAHVPTAAPRPRRQPRVRVSAQERARRRQQGIIGHLTTVLLQPRLFFATLPDTRHWLMVGLVAVLLTGYSAIAPLGDAAAKEAPLSVDMPIDGGFGEAPIDGTFQDFDSDPFAAPLPTDQGLGGDISPDGAATDVNARISGAVVANAWMVGAWLFQAVLLMIVSLLNGIRPSFARNLQIVVWASVPLLLFMVVQLIFHAIGGSGTAAGLSALIPRWQAYNTFSAEAQWLVISALTQTTIFSVYGLLLLFFGARDALAGRWLVCLLVVLAWVCVAILVPVLTNTLPLPVAPL